MFDSSTDEFVLSQVRDNFGFITAMSFPASKGSSKNADGITKEQWFSELSWMNFMFFFHAFPVAVRRGLLNPAEIAIGQEIIDMINTAMDGRVPA